MKSLTQTINENMQASVVMTVLDKKSVKTFANKQKEIKFVGADPSFLVYQVKDGTPYIFFSTKKGMQEYVNSSLEKNGKKIAQEIANIKPGEALQIEDGSIWVKIIKS